MPSIPSELAYALSVRVKDLTINEWMDTDASEMYLVGTLQRAFEEGKEEGREMVADQNAAEAKTAS